jgi:hypothetical protein
MQARGASAAGRRVAASAVKSRQLKKSRQSWADLSFEEQTQRIVNALQSRSTGSMNALPDVRFRLWFFLSH